MLKHSGGPLPAMNALRAFDAAARHLSFGRAARELGIRQPAVSRYIADLERELGGRLFERTNRIVFLTPAGEVLQRAVAIALQRVAAGMITAASFTQDRRVIVACGHATTHLFVMPRFDVLRRTVGETVNVRILTLDYDMLDRLGENEVDIVLSYDQADNAPADGVTLFREAVMPVCAPGFAATHAQVLAGPVAGWGSLPLLRFARPARAWVSWHDWFETAGFPLTVPDYVDFEDYVYLIEAAVAGQGVALGWRHYIERHVDAGTLVPAAGGFVEFDRSCFAELTARGRQRPEARRCLDALAGLAHDAAVERAANDRPGERPCNPAEPAIVGR